MPMLERVLEPLGVCFRWRAAMVLQLADLAERPSLPAGYAIIPWERARLEEVTAVDWRAYRRTIDSVLYWRYFQSPAGCRRMWDEALRGRFGRFDADRTRLLVREGQVCGDVLCSLRTPDEGFIGNLAVLPEHRGGTGRALLLTALRAYQDAGFDRVSLAVTLANRRAYNLYTALGFRRRYLFPVASRPGAAAAGSEPWPAVGDQRRACP
jgi:ribosomal protein S18 acetylase RimI-like enzyme